MPNRHFTEEENNKWLAGLPKKSIAVKLIIKSDRGNILLVKPSYKKTWQFPGGGVEPNEEPKEAVVREVKEELGLDIDAEDLKLIDSVLRREHDNLILIYEYTKKLGEHQKFNLDYTEVEDFRFEDINQIAPLLGDYYSQFWSSYTKL